MVVKIKGLARGKYKNSKKYKLNYVPINYNGKTGFCYKNTTVEFSLLTSHEKEKEKLENANHWKCEKCNKLFARFRQLKSHKEEHHSY